MKKLMGCPAWLELSDDRTSFIMLEDRAETVRYIFQLSIAGFGAYSIAKKLSASQTPTFKAGGKWDQSVVFNILSNRATHGEYVPGKYKKKNSPPIAGEAISNFYPAVITKEVFETSLAARRKNWSSGRGRKGKLVTNLFAGLATCSYCGGAVKFVSNGPSKSLICETVLGGSGCSRYGWSYGDFEAAFFNLLNNDDKISPIFAARLSHLKSAVERKSEDETYNARVNLSVQLRDGTISEIRIAAAGQEVPVSRRSVIVRDHPDRVFKIVLFDGYASVGRPVPAVRSVSFDAVNISRELGLTARQGQLVALLAEGESLLVASSLLKMKFETARWHLREIFAGKDIHSQEELIERAFALCPPNSRI